MKNDYLDYGRESRRRSAGKKTAIAAVIVLLVAAAAGLTVFFVSSYYYEVIEEQDESAYATPIPISVAETMKENSSLEQTGVYGLWYSEEEPGGEDETDSIYHPEEHLWMGDFKDERKRVTAKGIYISASYMTAKFDKAVELVESTELNTMVIDVKTEDGYITFKMDGSETAKEIGALTNSIPDIRKTIKKLKEKDIYVVARIVSMMDPKLAKYHPELAVTKKDGTLFKDNAGKAWLNPFKEGVWDYLIEISKECVNVGFDEINFDYIRFSTGKGMNDVDFSADAGERTRIDAITDGLRRICEVIKPMGAFVSCDVYGAIVTSTVDAKIVGQSFYRMSQYVDYICPMVYPSHYADGYYNLDHPDMHPYELVNHALMDANKVLYMIDSDGNKADVRPWLQDFTASWIRHHLDYGAKEVRDQIDAVYDSGYSSWLLWNAGIEYTRGALLGS
ncbi:MAG: putative glycoside hydrolase [Lachnospiraceae bacterium]|nr:putative glycoside hydrolase [Lachnospiraceae bacterium]